MQNEMVKDADGGSPADSGSRRLKSILDAREVARGPGPMLPNNENLKVHSANEGYGSDKVFASGERK